MMWLLSKLPFLAHIKLIAISFGVGLLLGAGLVWYYSDCDSEVESARAAQLKACQENITLTEGINHEIAKEVDADKRRIAKLERLLADKQLYIATRTTPASLASGRGCDNAIGISGEWLTNYAADFKSSQLTVMACKKWIAAKLEQNGEPIPIGLLE